MKLVNLSTLALLAATVAAQNLEDPVEDKIAVVNEEEIDFGYDNDFYGESAVEEEHELESAKRQLTHDSSYYSYYSYYYYSYYDYSSYDYSSYYYSYYSYYYYSYYYSYYSYYYYDYSSYSSSLDYSYAYDYSYSSYSDSYSYSDSSSSSSSDDVFVYYLTDETCNIIDFTEYGTLTYYNNNGTYEMLMYSEDFEYGYIYCSLGDIVYVDLDVGIYAYTIEGSEYPDFEEECLDWGQMIFVIGYDDDDVYQYYYEGPSGQKLYLHYDVDSFYEVYTNKTEECDSTDYDDYYDYDSYYSYDDTYESYDYYYYDYYYGDSYYYEEEESAMDYLAGEWEYISEAYMGDGSIFIKTTIATSAMIAAVSV